ncbi:alpha/beta fold hydrolase [Marinobacter nanhaiticus D15-8W]|uniref:Alpha/beta fold hydrolase n=1 Tax=Marinobacter nanhaiticus D15-8W TaxID=626887 RepID=N6VYR4_9GAMM|nr:alpha/beta fold hydrolase [Marinobacter nanhaiticus]ENO15400.1 alpha/beta fold hydrolase [Marinobacter nanhaiticus D15-8W]BES73753.1 alpha/beta fold hydrolase [Marinobacter nanhaiticus D15-8W]
MAADSKLLRFTLIILAGLWLSGCAASSSRYEPAPQQLQAQPVGDFDEYARQVRNHLEQYRVAIDGFPLEDQVAWNMPYEIPPATTCNADSESVGILLVHGLSDSPYMFRDLANTLAARCVRVRTLLLQGHGTRPGDLVDAEADVWRAQVDAHFAALRETVDHAFIGGFSLGGALATERALDPDQPAPAGLLAVAPAWELNGLRDYLWLAPYAAWFRDFVEEEPELNPVKYESLAINAAAQVADVRAGVQAILSAREQIDLPLMLVATEADSVINLPFLAQQFKFRFEHPASRMLVFRDTRETLPELLNDPRIRSLNSYLPEARVLELSHMSLNIAPDNPLYGINGPLNRCLEPNGLTLQDCEALAEDDLWFGAWHPGALEVPTSRLTYNPYFDVVADTLTQFMQAALAGADESPYTAIHEPDR